MISFLIALPIAIMIFFPKTDAAKWLHKHLVVDLIRSVAQFERRQFIYLFLMITMMHSLLPLMSVEMATLIIADMSLYYDAAITAYIVSFVGRTKSIWMAMKLKISGIFLRRGRERKGSTTKEDKPTPRKADNDDPDPIYQLTAIVRLAA